ncbi:3-oxo-tetronate kinase [Shinella sp. BYT-45]|uniref:3-oxo-tetronate kinase n=1 Tax=Shinella sp. BYT-45 TaxID=3377377 RepID=UPI00397F72AF
MFIGAIADDLTGATDLCLMLARGGMRVVQVIGVPDAAFDFAAADALVVALKSRTIPRAEAVDLSLAAARRLIDAGARQLFFKYCSTFDSTDDGNIGPVAEALLGLAGAALTIACPAFPANGRTVYRGHLFVGDQLLSDSSMKDHPLTPMRDANLVRVLQKQTALPVGLVGYGTVEKGAEAIRAAFDKAAGEGLRMLVVDAVTDDQLRTIGKAAAGLKLVTGGSGVAIGLPANFGFEEGKANALPFPAPAGRAAIIAGSCSAATRRQIAAARGAGVPALKIDPQDIADGRMTAEAAARWAVESGHATPLVYSSNDPAEVARAQSALGRKRAGELVEHLLAGVAVRLRAAGFRRFVVAGGETSGAVVNALGPAALAIGPEIDPGVPWTVSLGSEPPLALALKSGNFGTDDFFLKAWELLQ